MKKRSSKIKTKIKNKLLNYLSILLMASLMLIGLKVYSACGNGLTFAQISDAHFSSANTNTSYRLTAESGELLQDAIGQVNSTPNVDFTMFTGDLINKPYRKELTKFFTYANQLNMPWYAVYGNHDICIGGYLSKKVYLGMLKSNNKNFNFSKSYYSFSPKKGYKVIGLDSVIDTRITSNGEIPQLELKWLDRELAKSKNDVVLIFLHHPVVEPLHSQNHMLLNSDRVLSIINKYDNPIAVFSGHYHTTKIIQRGHALFVSTPSMVSYPNAFRIVKITSNKDNVVFDIKLKETRYSDVQKRARMMAFGARSYYGKESDRNGTYIIKKK